MRRLPPHGKDKCGSPRVTLRIQQLKEKKGKNNSQMSGDHLEFNSGSLEGGGKDDDMSSSNLNPDEENNTDKENTNDANGNGDSAKLEVQSAPVKRTYSFEEEEDGRKRRRKDDGSRGKGGSNNSGSPKSALNIESEGEEQKSTESPGPKVPPLKIVISGVSLEETGSGGRNGKNGSGRHHLPYVVASSTETEVSSPPSAPDESERGGSAGSGEEVASNAPVEKGSKAHQRILRSHRGKKTSESRSSKESPSAKESGSAASSPAAAETNSPQQVSHSPMGAETESEDKTAATGSPAPAASQTTRSNTPEKIPSPQPPTPQVTPQELHPRKRKIRPKDNQNATNSSSSTSNVQNTVSTSGSNADSSNDENSTSDTVSIHNIESISNSYQLFLNIRKQIDRKRKGLFPVQPKPPQGFKDYLMNRCTYVLANNSNNRIPPSMASPPLSLPTEIKDLFVSQEKDRHRLLMQHVIEKEKLVLSVEQEILRVHGRAARALANQSLPFSACTILRDEEVYSAITPEQEEKDRNARSRYNGRLFLSWLQDVDDKWEKIKEAMLLRHHNEAESLHAVQKMDWEWKMKEIGICEFKAAPVIDDTHVPMVHVSDDFDLLPA